MRSLLSLLGEAVQRAASEVTLESGQPVVYMTERGTEAETEVLPGPELFDMIVSAVDEGQQVELAVGNPVEFELDAGARWSVHAEPGMEGIRVRACRPAAPPPGIKLDIELDYNPHAAGDLSGVPSGLPSGVPSGVPSGTPSGLALDSTPAAPISTFSPPPLTPSTPPDESGTDFSQTAGDAVAPFESGTWALDDDEEFDVGSAPMPDEGSMPTGFVAAGDDGQHIGVPADDDDEQFEPFSTPTPEADAERRRTLSPTVRAMDAAGARARHAATVRDLPVSEGASERQTVRAMAMPAPPPAVPAPAASPPDGGPGASSPRGASLAGLGELVADIGPGTLVYVREPGLAEALAATFPVRRLIIDDTTELDDVTLMSRSAPAGSIVVVRREDPSAILGWLLRRLEEGFRVFVESRAQTQAGARRILLGVAATDRSEAWLESHSCVAVEIRDGGPRLTAG